MDVIGGGALNVDLFYKVPSLTLAGLSSSRERR